MSTEVLKSKKSIRGLSARVAGAGKLPAPLKLQSTASETVPSIALPSPSLPSPSFSLSFASFGYDGPSSSSNNTGSTTPNLSFPTTPEPLLHPSPKPNIPIANSENIVPPSPRTRAAKLLGIGFPSSSSASKEGGARSTKDEDELPSKRPGTFRTRSTSFHALSSSFRSNSNSNILPPPSPSIPTSTPLSTSFTPRDILPSSPSSSTWTHRLSVKLRPRKSVPNLRAQSPPPPPVPSQPLFSSHPRTRSSSASPKGSAAPLSPLPPPKDPFAPPTPPPAPRQRSTSFAGAAATNGMMSGGGGGLKSPRLSPSMLDLALEARGLIQLEGRARKASEGGGAPVAVVSSSSGFATPSTLGSVPPSPLSISQNSTATTASSAASTYRTGSSTSGSSSRQVSESPKPPSAVVYSPSSPVPTSPLPPLPTDADWRPPFSPQLPSSPTTTATKEDLKGLGAGTVGASGGGGEGRGRRGWNSGEGQGAGGDGFGGAGGRGEMPSGPNRPRRVDDGSNPNGGGGGPTRDGDDERRDDRRIDRTTVEDDSDSDDSFSSSSSSSSDDEDANSRRPPALTSPRVEADSDDDVPLAVAHPAALSVQKSLRLSRRKEKHERKLREKKLERGNRSPPSRRRDAPPTSNSNSTTTASGTDPHGHHSRREAERREREPKKELPSAYGAGQEGVFVAEELERKLLAHLNEGVGSTSTARTRKASSSGTKSRGEGNGGYGYEESGGNSRAGEASTTARSRMMEKSRTLPLPPPPPPMDLSTQPTAATATSSFGAMNLGRAKSQSTQPSATSSLRTRGASNQPFPSSSTNNASHDRPLMRRRPSEPAPASSPPMPPPLPASTNFPLPPPRLTRPSLPHLLTSSSSTHSPNRPSPPKSPVPAVMPTETTRMFLEKMGGRAVEVEVGNATTAGMVLEGLRRKGELGGREGEEMMNGGWSVWEGGNDWGIERPLREYELLSEVSSSWNNETRLNAFIIKRCKISSLLTLQAIPNQPPNIIGWVQMEVKKGSWKKRFLEIREGSVWICKNDRGKDETFLCSMSAYDVYSFTRPYKAPKGRVWGLKSQDKIQFFEEPKDYIHIFTSSDERTWETMWRGITSARSYALTLSNPALFRSHLALQHSLSAHHPHSHAHSVNNNSLHHSSSPKPGVTSPQMGGGAAPNPLINPASLEFGAVGTGMGVGVGGIGGGGAVHGLGVLGGIGAIGNKGLFEKGSLLGKMHG